VWLFKISHVVLQLQFVLEAERKEENITAKCIYLFIYLFIYSVIYLLDIAEVSFLKCVSGKVTGEKCNEHPKSFRKR